MKHIVSTLLIILTTLSAFAQMTTKDSILAIVPTGDAVYRHGYLEQSNELKKIYDDVVRAVLQFDANKGGSGIYHRVDLDSVPNTMSMNDVMYLLSRIYNDVPELYIMGPTIPRYDYTLYKYWARVMLAYSPEIYLQQLLQIQDARDSILAPITPDMTTYEKLKVIHDGYIAWADYGGMSSAYSGTIRGGLIDRKAVCEGFSRTYLYLCQQAGLRCIYVSGQLKTADDPETWGNHAWNFVEVDGVWYLADITTDGAFPGITGYSAFLKGQDYFTANYKLTSSDGSDPNLSGIYQALPTLSDTDYDPLNPPTALASVSVESIKATKCLINGEICILRGGEVYDLMGRKKN